MPKFNLMTGNDIADRLGEDRKRVSNLLHNHQERIPKVAKAGITRLYAPSAVAAVKKALAKQRPSPHRREPTGL